MSKINKNKVEYNERSLIKLARALTMSEGDFSLILVRCNSPELREQILEKLKQEYPVEYQELALDHSTDTLYSSINQNLGSISPKALMIKSLESVNTLDRLLIAANLLRNKFQNFHFPLVLWVTDEIHKKLIRVAPDFQSWASAISFNPKSA
ncbi:MAG: hypothetical protein F6K24_15415 [Okeania sp. SIO2D1]|uniref:hypothetical protein n=1 Tax=Okeania sp. SIO2C9 TaxID=2607791 RepID=UPI0013B9D331|nr:hypothetical protein [Okeania sp. SIO2C9]NEQ77710.1 hypothetical protein [Okeania sp. SIO2C9]NES66540.1 hypothetical protein [Okeania sp. SIO2D1]